MTGLSHTIYNISTNSWIDLSIQYWLTCSIYPPPREGGGGVTRAQVCYNYTHQRPATSKIDHNAVVTPLRKAAASYEPRIAILGIWGDTWLTRGKYGIYVAVRGSYGAPTGSTWRLLPRKISPIYCRVSYVAVTRIPSLVLRNTWHYVIIRYSYGELPKFVLRCSYEAALRKGVDHGINVVSHHVTCVPLNAVVGTMVLRMISQNGDLNMFERFCYVKPHKGPMQCKCMLTCVDL